MTSGQKSERTVGDEVAGEQDKVGGEGIRMVNHALEEERFGVLVEMNVAELNDAIAVEWFRQIGNGDRTVDNVDLMARNLTGVESQSGCGGAGADEEVAPGKTRRLRGRGVRHSS